MAKVLLYWRGVKIDYPQGFLAHSDGDVAIHALCDAILGALAMGDIGNHFPDTDDEYENIDSRILLRHVVGLMRRKKVINLAMLISQYARKHLRLRLTY